MVSPFLVENFMSRDRNWFFGRHFVIVYPIFDFFVVFWFFWITLTVACISPPNSFGRVLFWVRVHRDPPWPLTGVQKALTTWVLKGSCEPTLGGTHELPSDVTGRGQAGGQSVPQRLLTGKFLLMYWEKNKQGKKEKGWKLRRKEGKLKKGRWKIWNGSGKSDKKWWGLFFFHFWKMTEICFGSTKMGIFYWEKISRREKNQEKWLCPSEKYACFTPGVANSLS